MRCSVFSFLLLGLVLILLTAGGCSNVNVEATDESVPRTKRFFAMRWKAELPITGGRV